MKYPVGIQEFEKLRSEGYTYIDKTKYIYQLANNGSYYFLSRPRRFGKSLLLSTMKAYFEGKRELFEDLYLGEVEKEWTCYPVLHLDLNTRNYQAANDLRGILDEHLCKWEAIYGGDATRPLEARFGTTIENACKQTGHKVVILIDEYDKPLLQAIGNDTLQAEYRGILKAFYGNLKSQDGNIKFAFLTGVTKFGKVSVFSDLNNLNDLSTWGKTFGICGITETELHQNFKPSIEELALAYGMSYDDMSAKLKEQYDGYRFTEDEGLEGVYNPFSLLLTFYKMKLGDYWFETGTPTFLVELLKQSGYDLRQLQEEEVDGDVLNSVESMTTNPVPVIYQSGYLTIKSYDERFKTFRLGFPNKEVEQGFIKYLLPFYTPQPQQSSYAFIGNFVRDLETGKAEQFMQRMQTFFDDSDYRVAGKMELYFQNAMYILFRLMGFFTEVERSTSRGRVDVVLKTPEHVYIIEIKLDGSAADAMQQIENKGYAKPFAIDGRQIHKIGVSFSSETRGIEEYIIE